ncbi:hypothetical protein N7481_010389 [Penicillium waksmanii]|uniref:uncharacterized protein n=1 Tax=Penicillium waksmanii TaxID=69791 RepID=UPI002548FD14|nr:uncharacterized protein N7481_010389 [Penicillium waksmanii]KAJ5973179.1 hypothetical protein N7481_010389 [Penicillium waksmanii]
MYGGEANILICWEHRRISHIIEEMGNYDPPIYPKARFDIVWTDPSPYDTITREISEEYPGLDQEFDF